VDRHGDVHRFAWLGKDVVASRNALKVPAVPLEKPAHFLA
jgi:hypothetical protein